MRRGEAQPGVLWSNMLRVMGYNVVKYIKVRRVELS